jgi:hypothetical protein
LVACRRPARRIHFGVAGVVYTADGREYNVPTHDHAHVSPSGGRVSIWADDETEYILPALLISGLKVQSNGQHKP